MGGRYLPGLIPLVTALTLSSCGGGSTNTPPPPPSSSITSVTVSPASINVLPGNKQQFTATVQGTGAFSSLVTWSVNGSSGGNQFQGLIDATGLYSAPGNSPNPNTVTVTATSSQDVSKSGSASVVVGTSPFHITGITINPTSASLLTNGTQQFTSSVQGTGTFDSSVQWSSSAGTVSPTGLFTAPDTVSSSAIINVRVASAIDSTVAATATVTVTQGPPIITQIVPNSGGVGDLIQIQGHSFSGETTVYFSGPNGTQLAVPLGNGAGSQVGVNVPQSTISGPVYVQIQPPGGAVLTSNSVAFTRIPRLRIRANRRDLSAGETTQFQYRILGEDLSQSVSWTADVGTITPSGVYTAPGNVSTDSFAVVSGCIQGSQICDQFRMGLHPFRLDPAVPIVGSGQSLQLSAISGLSALSPTWNLTGPGSISPNGLYTASSLVADGGSTRVSASSGGATETASVGVSGAFPGIVNRVNDYIDLTQSYSPFGTSVSHVAVSGNRLYALVSSTTSGLAAPTYLWIDVYDLTDPQHPVWVDAVESAEPGNLVGCGHFLYELSSNSTTQYLATFDLSGTHPALMARNIDTSVNTYINSGCFSVTFPLGTSVAAGASAMADVADLSTGKAVHTSYSLPLGQAAASQLVSGASDGARLYLFYDASSQSHLSAFDLTKQPQALLGDLVVPSSDFKPRIAGHYLTSTPAVRQGFDSTDVFDVTGSTPVFVGNLPMGMFLDADPARAVYANEQTGLRVIDVSGSGAPVPYSNLFDGIISVLQDAAVSGSFVYFAEQNAGIAVYDVSVSGGPVWKGDLAFGSPLDNIPALDQLVAGTNLYIAVGSPSQGGGLLVYGTQTSPVPFVGSFSTGSSVAQALAISGRTLLLGTVSSTYILDVTNPGSPSQIGTIPIGTTSLASSGNFLYAGTVDNRLLVFDISNAASPVQKGAVAIPALSIQMRTNGTQLFVADSTAGLLIYDVSVPTAPTLLSTTQPSSDVVGLAMDGNLALLAAWEAGLVIVDCSNPAHPVIAGQHRLDTIDPFKLVNSELLNHAAAITLSGGVAYIGVDNFDTADPPNEGNDTIYGFDYRQPVAPRIVSLTAKVIVDNGVSTLASNASSLFAGGVTALFEMDITRPRNTINLFYLPDVLRPPVNLGILNPPVPATITQKMRFTHN